MMRGSLLLSTICLIVPRAGLAQDTPFRISLVAAVVAHGMDVGSTQRCLSEGRCREVNPWLARYEDPLRFSAAKMLVASLSLWGTAKLHKSHPKWAIVANVAQAVGFSIVAVRNARVGKPATP